MADNDTDWAADDPEQSGDEQLSPLNNALYLLEDARGELCELEALFELLGHPRLMREPRNISARLEKVIQILALHSKNDDGIPAQPSDSAPSFVLGEHDPRAHGDRPYTARLEVEPPAEPQPAVVVRDVLKEIAEEKITPNQLQFLEEQAAQHGVHPMELAALARNYGADNLGELKDIDYSRLVRDIYRSGAVAGVRKKALRR